MKNYSNLLQIQFPNAIWFFTLHQATPLTQSQLYILWWFAIAPLRVLRAGKYLHDNIM